MQKNNISKLSESFDIIGFLDTYKIKYSFTGSYVSSNYIGIDVCPFCGKEKMHSGINKDKHFFNCWICGGHSLFNYIKRQLKITNKETYKILISFQTNSKIIKFNKNQTLISNCVFPERTKKHMDLRFKKYLKKRGYPFKIIKKYNIKNTGETGDFCHMLIFPFYINKKLMTYTGRAISKKVYKDCPSEKSVKIPKEILYNFDNLQENENCLIVEGIFDCLKIGDNCIATSTSNMTEKQIKLLLSKYPKKIFVCFDSEYDAQEHAKKICGTLSLYTKTERIELEKGDIGDLSSEQGLYLRKVLNLKGDQY